LKSSFFSIKKITFYFSHHQCGRSLAATLQDGPQDGEDGAENGVER
jgi:hypothetical protein